MARKNTWFLLCENLLDYLDTSKDLPDFIILDINMPQMSGQAFLMNIKSEMDLHHMPVIIFSTTDNLVTINLASIATTLGRSLICLYLAMKRG